MLRDNVLMLIVSLTILLVIWLPEWPIVPIKYSLSSLNLGKSICLCYPLCPYVCYPLCLSTYVCLPCLSVCVCAYPLCLLSVCMCVYHLMSVCLCVCNYSRMATIKGVAFAQVNMTCYSSNIYIMSLFYILQM